MRNLLLRFSQNLFRNIVTLLHELEFEINAEIIHSIRVELKKVRFLAVQVKYYIPGIKMKKAYKPFKVLFKETGNKR